MSVLAAIAETCSSFLNTPAQIISYHFVIDGNLHITVEGEPAITVGAGEVVLLPRNDTHTLASGPGLKPVIASELIQRSPDGGLASAVYGGGGAETHLVCGFLASDDLYNPLIAALPRLLKLDVRTGLSRDWIESSVRVAASELAQGRFASSACCLGFRVAAGRGGTHYASAWMIARRDGSGSYDPQIGRVLALIHHRIAEPWSAEALAKEVAMSRSAFVERFTALVGLPPIRYLTQWRLRTAQLHLKETRKSVAQLANLVGYESEEAFSRAFKREFGQPPARWRDQHSPA
jgi:AraC-like DNA-binding protein